MNIKLTHKYLIIEDENYDVTYRRDQIIGVQRNRTQVVIVAHNAATTLDSPSPEEARKTHRYLLKELFGV